MLFKRFFININEKLALKLVQLEKRLNEKELCSTKLNEINKSIKKLIFACATCISHELAHYKVNIYFNNKLKQINCD